MVPSLPENPVEGEGGGKVENRKWKVEGLGNGERGKTAPNEVGEASGGLASVGL